MPLNAENKYIWVKSATPEPYTVLEGKVVTKSTYEDISLYLEKKLNKYTAFEPNSNLYSISSEKESIFNMLILKQDLTFGIVWMGDINLSNQNIEKSNFLDNLDIFVSNLENATNNTEEKNLIELKMFKHQISIYR